MLTILLAVVLLLAVIFSDQFKFSVNGQFNPNAILSIVLVGEYLVYIDICNFLVGILIRSSGINIFRIS